MTVTRFLLKDKVLVTGWILTGLSAALFCLPAIKPDGFAIFSGFFLIHFLLAIGFVAAPLLSPDRPQGNRMHYHAIKLVLFLISAYSLNRDLEVFSQSPVWLCVVLVTVCVNYLGSAFFYDLPHPVRYAVFFVLGVSMVLFVYLSLYLVSLYIFSLLALIALGLSVHSFIPLLFSIYTLRLAGWLAGGQRKWWLSFLAGIGFSLVFFIVYALAWHGRVAQINKQYNAVVTNGANNPLPLWVQVAQHTDNSLLTEKIMKTGLVYQQGNWSNNFLWDIPERRMADEQKLHDPLVSVASLFSGPVNLSEDDRIKVLESGYHARHQTLDRLWTGINLSTSDVNTQIKVWPELHLAYTEKTITVKNNRNGGWPGQEEAIYTFHLPEGAVITALSLWIDGYEAKGILTSKGKADDAYKTIVGYESRDPSVVHWQEGNTVSVRVFPVPVHAVRTFEIGITAPLRQQDGKLAYDNTWFEGPNADGAKETVRVEMVSAPRSFIHSASYQSSDARVFTTSRSYEPVWSLDFNDEILRGNNFSFDGSNYSIVPYDKQRVPAAITDVYLDINRSWTDEELEAVLGATKGKKIWVYQNGLQQLDPQNDRVLKDLRSLHFSIFPFYLVPDRTHALVVSKSGDYTPNISDLEGSVFMGKLRASAGGERIRLFHLDGDVSPYLRSLTEFRLFDVEYGKPALLQKLLEHGEFVHDEESDNSVIVHTAGIRIVKTPGSAASNAPDHLMRLFAYNHILKELGASALIHDRDNSLLVAEAQKAYVVSPVSSLVVLETQQDYDRFGIRDDLNSLKNATQGNKGAVPEPAEWAIILLVATVFGFFLLKWKFA